MDHVPRFAFAIGEIKASKKTRTAASRGAPTHSAIVAGGIGELIDSELLAK